MTEIEYLKQLGLKDMELKDKEIEIAEKIAILNKFEKINQDLRDNYDQFKAVAEPEIERLQKENTELEQINSEGLAQLNIENGKLIIENENLRKENAELKRIVKMVAMINKCIYTNEGIKAIYAEAEKVLKL